MPLTPPRPQPEFGSHSCDSPCSPGQCPLWSTDAILATLPPRKIVPTASLEFDSQEGSGEASGGGTLERQGTPRLLWCYGPLSRAAPTPTPIALSSHPFGSSLHLPVTSESSAGSQFGLQKHYTLISKWILNTSFKEGQGLAGNQWALVAWSPILAIRHRSRCEETGALLESEQLFSHNPGHNWKLSVGSPRREGKGHHLMKKLQNEPGK